MNEHGTVAAIDKAADCQSTQLVQALFEDSDGVCIRPIESWTEDGLKRSRVDYDNLRWPRAGGITPITVRGLKAAAQRVNAGLCFGVCPRFKPSKGYDLSWQIRAVRCVWADIDDTQDQSVIDKRISDAGLPMPTVKVDSGNGVHLYWRLEEPYLIDDVSNPPQVKEEWFELTKGRLLGKRRSLSYFVDEHGDRVWLNDRETGRSLPQASPDLSNRALHFQDIVKGVAKKIGGDHTSDLARLLRLPGTMNLKNARNGDEPKPCEIISINEDRHPLSAFEKFAEFSKDRQERETIAKIALPQTRKISPGKQDKLNNYINRSATAANGHRSEADFSLCCFAIEKGVAADEVWSQVSHVGKFEQRGRDYFDLTWSKAERTARRRIFEKSKPRENAATTATGGGGSTDESGSMKPMKVVNALITVTDDGAKHVQPYPMRAILHQVNSICSDWPRRVASALFIDDGDDGICWLEKPSQTVAHIGLKSSDPPEFYTTPGCHTKTELHNALQMTARAYEYCEDFPHIPPVENHYYSCPSYQPGNGETISQLLDRFEPATLIDRDLILSLIMTLFWGGRRGTRPAFLITAEKGQGSGKSKLIELLSYIVGGAISVTAGEKIADLKKRMLSNEGLSSRVVLLDNIKSDKFSWGDLEALITAPTISGHRIYVGEFTRPNLFTFCFTLNGPSLSEDLAQRCVVIKLKKPVNSTGWLEDTYKFIDDKRDAIISDVVGKFSEAPVPMKKYSRWQTWEQEVLSRTADPNDAQQVILERQQKCSGDNETSAILQDEIEYELRKMTYDPDTEEVFIPTRVLAVMMEKALNKRITTVGAGRQIRQMVEGGIVTRFRISKNNNRRGVYWVPTEPDEGGAKYDIDARMNQNHHI